MRNAFSSYHPIVNFAFFAAVLLFTVFFLNPVFMAISLIASIVFAVQTRGKKGIVICLFGALPMFLLVAVFNPIFVHQGMTLLFYIDDNPVTLEAILYGIASGAMLAAVILWFASYDKVMTTDKFIYLFGRITPALALLISMTLRFVPKLKNQITVIAHAQKTVGMDMSCGNIFKRVKHGIRIVSILITWALENAIETSDSMKARGYGLRGRTSFSLFRFTRRDAYCLALFAIEIMICGVGCALHIAYFQYYPYIKYAGASTCQCSMIAAYAMLCLTPSVIEIVEDYKWRFLTSKI